MAAPGRDWAVEAVVRGAALGMLVSVWIAAIAQSGAIAVQEHLSLYLNRERYPWTPQLDSNMDSGKVTVKIPADLMTLEAVGAVAHRIRVALRRAGHGDVVSCCELTYEPFTPDTPQFGRKWHQLVLTLDRALDSRRVAALLLAAGTPPSAHITYTDQMRLCGDSVGQGW